MNAPEQTLYPPRYWTSARPNVASGFDLRSSDNALLSLFYGSAEHARQHDWLNAGRTLIDKTYIQLLWEAAGLTYAGSSAHDIATALDSFIRSDLQPRWETWEELDNEERHAIACRLVHQAASGLFGSGYQAVSASWLLYYLVPQLPVFPLRAESAGTYLPHHQQHRARFARALPYLLHSVPRAEYGSAKQQQVIDKVLRSSDWWLRHCYLQRSAGTTGSGEGGSALQD